MRDPVRIDTFCRKLAQAWHKLPDWRFGQFMMNVLGEMSHSGLDPFFPEEDEMIKFIERYVERTCGRPKDEPLIASFSETELDKLWGDADSYESFKHMLKLAAKPEKKQREWSNYIKDEKTGYEYCFSIPENQSAKVKVRIPDVENGYLVGTASCSPKDKFDLRTGIQLAAARAEAKVAAAEHNFMADMLYESWLQYMEAVHRVDTLMDHIYERTAK